MPGGALVTHLLYAEEAAPTGRSHRARPLLRVRSVERRSNVLDLVAEFIEVTPDDPADVTRP